MADAIKDCSRRRDLILDPFAGSGTTIIAAEKTGRRARVSEIDPHYCDVIVRRWQAYTGKSAIHAATGLSFEEIEVKRGTTNEIEEMRDDQDAPIPGKDQAPRSRKQRTMGSAMASRPCIRSSSPANPAIRRAGQRVCATSGRTSKPRSKPP